MPTATPFPATPLPTAPLPGARRVVATLLAIAALVTSAGCSSDDDASSTTGDPPSTTAAVSGAITVSAAASLTEAFTAITEDFQEANPDAEVTINFGSSGQLATQITEGAPADVAAFADEAPMTTLSDADLLAGPAEVVARNQLVIVTKPDNPAGVESLADLADVGVVSLCAETAPCGKHADQALSTAGVTLEPSTVTRGQDVKATLTAVTEGDADAAIVYVSDAAVAGDAVASVEVAEADNVLAHYPIAVVGASTNGDTAAAFMEWVLGEKGQARLQEAGFLAP